MQARRPSRLQTPCLGRLLLPPIPTNLRLLSPLLQHSRTIGISKKKHLTLPLPQSVKNAPHAPPSSSQSALQEKNHRHSFPIQIATKNHRHQPTSTKDSVDLAASSTVCNLPNSPAITGDSSFALLFTYERMRHPSTTSAAGAHSTIRPPSAHSTNGPPSGGATSTRGLAPMALAATVDFPHSNAQHMRRRSSTISPWYTSLASNSQQRKCVRRRHRSLSIPDTALPSTYTAQIQVTAFACTIAPFGNTWAAAAAASARTAASTKRWDSKKLTMSHLSQPRNS